MTRPGATSLVLLLTALAFGGGWLLRADEGPGSAPPPEDSGAAPATGPAGGEDLDRALLEDTRAQLAREAKRTGELEAQRKELAAQRAARSPAAAQDARDRESVQAPYAFRGLERALSTMDWGQAGEAVSHMTPLLAAWGKSISAGQPGAMPAGEIQRWNGPLVNVAVAAANAKVPGTGINGAFTHPAIIVNLVHVTLAEAGRPLSATQAQRLGELGERYVEDDARRLAAYPGGTFALRKTIDEARLKDRLFADIDLLLDAEQQDVLHPEAVRGRLALDLFSSGVIWLTIAQPLTAASRDGLAAALAKQAMRHFGVAAAQQPALEDAAAHWARGLDEAWLRAPGDALDRAGRVHVSRVYTAAEHQLAFFQLLVQKLPDDSDLAAKVREETSIAYPALE